MNRVPKPSENSSVHGSGPLLELLDIDLAACQAPEKNSRSGSDMLKTFRQMLDEMSANSDAVECRDMMADPDLARYLVGRTGEAKG